MENTPTPIPEIPAIVEKPKTNYLNLILISLCFVLFLAGAYYLGKQSSTTPVSNSVVVLPKTTAIPTNVTDPTLNWKTYNNTQFGFTFKYPEEFTTKIETNGGNMGWWSVTVGKNLNNTFQSFFSITDRGGVDTNYMDWYKKYYRDYGDYNQMVKKQTIGNNIVYAFLEPGMGDGDFSYGITSPNNKTFFIYTTPNRIETDPIFNQILSTFKFTESKENQLSFATINYSKYNLSFKIPKGWYFSNDAMNGNYQQINKDITINSGYNSLFITNNPDSETLLTINLDPSTPKNFNIIQEGNTPEFSQIISSIKFTN